MIVFENPGSPEGRNLSREHNPETAFDITNITLAEALRFAVAGQRNWLFRSIKLDQAKWEKAGIVIGESVYTTDSHKCPDPKNTDPKDKKKQKEQARKLCLAYLREEIRLIQPKAILAFGNYARRSVEGLCCVNWSDDKNLMANDKRVQIVGGRLYAVLPHPNGIWRRPTMALDDFEAAIDFVFAEVKSFLGKA
jgi:uracil-DNA glycosylase family 4